MNKYILFFFFLNGSLLNGQKVEIPWLSHLGGKNNMTLRASISTKANVVASDGKKYAANTLYIDPQRAYFKIIDPDRLDVFGIDGKYYWTHNGQVEKEAPPFVDEFVRGHQFHAHILHFNKIHPKLSTPVADEFNDQDCLMIKGSGRGLPWKMYYIDGDDPIGMIMEREDEPDINMVFSNWKMSSGIKLPYTIDIDDGDRTFQYQYEEIRMNEGEADDFRLKMSLLTDEQVLMRLHRIGMDDHLFERTEGLHQMRHDTFTIVSRGRVFGTSGEEFDTTMKSIMDSRDHSYDDRIRPIIKISEDGTLGWVIVEMDAEGVMLNKKGQESGDLYFQSAWIELYEKIDGHWKMVGNVSNFLPEK